MSAATSYLQKLAAYREHPLYLRLTQDTQAALDQILPLYQFTLQEFSWLAETAGDLYQWQEAPLAALWTKAKNRTPAWEDKRSEKKACLEALKAEVTAIRSKAKKYPLQSPKLVQQRPDFEVRTGSPVALGSCPVYSDKTVCCGLKTMDVVENCGFNCSYCSIQTFYGNKIVFHADLEQQLNALQLEPGRRYHIGVGQASDALAWGNHMGLLDALVHFAQKHPNVLLELKSKAAEVSYFLDHEIPANMLCSWTLNSETVAAHEEHFTAAVKARLAAAKEVTNRGLRVAFHLHPLVFYQGWEAEYGNLVETLLAEFSPSQVAFLSLGTVTLIKPVLKALREAGQFTKISQMEVVPDPHGRLTYPDATKIMLYKMLLQLLAPWKGKVFTYLCMEKAALWQSVFGFAYSDNQEFEKQLLDAAYR